MTDCLSCRRPRRRQTTPNDIVCPRFAATGERTMDSMLVAACAELGAEADRHERMLADPAIQMVDGIARPVPWAPPPISRLEYFATAALNGLVMARPAANAAALVNQTWLIAELMEAEAEKRAVTGSRPRSGSLCEWCLANQYNHPRCKNQFCACQRCQP